MKPFSFDDVFVGLAVAGLAFFVFSLTLRPAPERRQLQLAMVFKLLATFAYGSIVCFWYEAGDTLWYHAVGIQNAEYLRSDLTRGTDNYLTNDTPFFWLFSGDQTDRLVSFSGFVHFLTLDSFLGSSIIFSLLGFLGELLLYWTFTALYPAPRLRSWWTIGFLFLPSVTLWSAGILKDPLGLCGVGCATWAIHRYLTTLQLRYAGLAVLGLYIIALFRLQIVPVYLVAVMPWLLSKSGARSALSQRSFSRWLAGMALSVLAVYAVSRIGDLDSRYELSAQGAQSALALGQEYQKAGSYVQAGSTVDVAVKDHSLAGMILGWPFAAALVLFRPYPWEVRSPLQLIASLENLAIMFFTLRAIRRMLGGGMPKLTQILLSPMFLTCLVFVALFTLAVGASTPNLGSASRYRIVAMPFFIAMMVIIEHNTAYFSHHMSPIRDSSSGARSPSRTMVRGRDRNTPSGMGDVPSNYAAEDLRLSETDAGRTDKRDEQSDALWFGKLVDAALGCFAHGLDLPTAADRVVLFAVR